MDEGRNMVLLFPTLLNLDTPELRENFQNQWVETEFSVITLTMSRCHIFYPQRVADIPDGKPKWTGLDDKSELMDEP